MYQDDIDYATRRLNNTVVRLQDGSPFYVTRTFYNEDGMMCHHGRNLSTNETQTVFHSDLNLEPVPLGFINTSSDMVFVARKPMRRDWKQGLSHNSMVTYGRLRPDEVNLKLLVQPILRQYPSFSRALQSLKGKKNSIAFSRDFGLTKKDGDILLCYRQHEVGSLVDDLPTLYSSKTFLQQHLDEAMGA
jgi:hypothetical protein